MTLECDGKMTRSTTRICAQDPNPNTSPHHPSYIYPSEPGELWNGHPVPATAAHDAPATPQAAELLQLNAV